MLPLSSPSQRACCLNCHAALSSGRHSIALSFNFLSCLFSSSIHGTNQYCDTLIRLKAWRKCRCSLVEPSQARQMISQMISNKFLCSSPWVCLIFHDVKFTCLFVFFNSHRLLSFSTTRWIWRIRRQRRCTLRCWSLRRRLHSRCSIGQRTSACSKTSQEMAFILGTRIYTHYACTQIVVGALMCCSSIKGPR